MASHHIPRLAITGGIGSGKSTALAFLRDRGAAVLSSDDIVHGLLAEPTIVGELVAHFGDEVVAGEGINRPVLARIVFDDTTELAWLEAQLHPHVKRAIVAWTRAQDRSAALPSLLVVEVPMLFESGMAELFDKVLVITAPETVRRKRLAAKMSATEFRQRSSQQLDEHAKAMRGDYVFENKGSRKDLREFIAETHAAIIAG